MCAQCGCAACAFDAWQLAGVDADGHEFAEPCSCNVHWRAEEIRGRVEWRSVAREEERAAA